MLERGVGIENSDGCILWKPLNQDIKSVRMTASSAGG